VEYDSADLSLKHVSEQDQLRVIEELWHACEYACARKETSRAGGVMILRFFHGYYPGEIGAITSSSKAAVSESLRAAREEAIRYLRSPQSLRCIGAGKVHRLARGDFRSDTEGILVALRNPTFAASKAACIPHDVLRRMYEAGLEPVHKTILAHMVSCRPCLDTVNQILRLPLLSTRDPMEMTGRDNRRPDDPDGSGTSSSGGVERAVK
jgi:hypothetical protein